MRPSAAETFLKLLAQNLHVVAGPVVTLVYPLYASIRAIETKSIGDDQQWLTYWVLYSIITLFELTFAKLIEWLPFWAYAKLIFTCWLVIPYFSGAASVYNNVVRPYIVTRQKSVNIWYVPNMKDVFSKPDDIITAAEKYVEQNGPEAFEKIIQRSNRETMSSKKFANSYSFYDDNYKYEDEHRY
ncbi:HVA22-like protein A [Perilla frutescens var. hirtella]|uniref:HVA22-like protein n=1 Tax=Perilla frutescens var. hirtella TaxID=608512 RepID=A0AAD4ILZ9_PERFH|nr:HVA22-like protein A [Perilla frutescens var. hirtella]